MTSRGPPLIRNNLLIRVLSSLSWIRILRATPTRHQLYGHLPPITKTIQVRRTRHAGHCWKSRDEFISDVLQWTPTYGRAKVGGPAGTYIQQLCEDTGCCPKDLLEAMNDREKWRERVRDIRVGDTTWWWWYKHLRNTSFFFLHINLILFFKWIWSLVDCLVDGISRWAGHLMQNHISGIFFFFFSFVVNDLYLFFFTLRKGTTKRVFLFFLELTMFYLQPF